MAATELVFNDKERVGAWVAARVDQTASWGSFYAMGAERDGQLLAGIVFNNYNGSNCTAHICIEKPGKYLHDLLTHACRYAFECCKLERLTGLVPADLPKVLAFDLRLGFEPEFIMRKAAPGGQDMHVLVMWRDACPWLPKE